MLVGLRMRLALWRKENKQGTGVVLIKLNYIVHTLPLLLESYIKVVKVPFVQEELHRFSLLVGV